jgi:hypothetical protein
MLDPHSGEVKIQLGTAGNRMVTVWTWPHVAGFFSYGELA